MPSMITVPALALAMSVGLADPPPPPIRVAPAATEQVLVAWLPGEVRCGGTVVDPVRLEQPLPSLAWGRVPDLGSLTLAFDIDPTGRTLNIRRTGQTQLARGAEDVAPSLAATRFAPGSGRPGCTIAYVPRQASLGTAPLGDLIRYSVHPISGRLPKTAWQRIYADGDCFGEQSPRIRNRAFPDFRAIPATPGVRDSALVDFDIDGNGKPRNVRIADSSGNAALDRESRRAIEASRFYAGERKGCRYPYWRDPAPLPAPPAPEEAAFRPEGATCPERREWVTEPRLRFAEPYRRRAIEGWAVVTYDVAPWGEISNIKVAASEPTEDFGMQAITVVRGARVATTQGFVGCVDRVRFVMGPSGAEE